MAVVYTYDRCIVMRIRYSVHDNGRRTDESGLASDLNDAVLTAGYLAKAQSMALRRKITWHEPGDLLEFEEEPEL